MFLVQHPVLLFVVALAILGVVAASKASPAAKKGRPPVRVQQSGTEFAPMKVLTDTEAKFFRQLESVLTDEWIFPQVAMSALIKPTGRGKQYWSSFGKIAQKRVDFAICRKDLSLIAIVELDDPSHDRREDEDVQRDAYLKSAGIRTVRFDVRKWPDDATIRAKLYPSMGRAAPRTSAPAPATGGASAPPAPEASPVTQDSQST